MVSEVPEVRREVRELAFLYEISRTLERSIDLRETVHPVLQAMGEHMGMFRATLSLLNRNTGEISIEAAYGLTSNQRERGRYRLGEGLTGTVIQTGEPMVVPRISADPRFLDRTRSRKDLGKKEVSFVSVPVWLGEEVIGALSADRHFVPGLSLEEDVRLLAIIASMIGQAVRLRHAAMEERQRLLDENVRLKEELKDRSRPSNIIGNSKVMRKTYELIARVAKSDATVLIRGESGTGKELVANAIHYGSLRAKKPFIKVNCAALPEAVIESELFGHEKGAFTGAHSRKPGRFELAHGGTLFLDEIGDLSMTTQTRLLRVLQEREFERVGGTETLKVDVRVLTATNRDLEGLAERGAFRQDLYFRLNVFPIQIPPLRDRKTDVPLLADFFAEKYGRAGHKTISRISTPAIDMLMSYHWPGNVRELENIVERAVLLSDDGVIHGYHLPPTLQTAEATGTALSDSLPDTLERVERELILDALKTSRGNMAKAARTLGISERLIGIRIKKHRIDVKRFRTKR